MDHSEEPRSPGGEEMSPAGEDAAVTHDPPARSGRRRARRDGRTRRWYQLSTLLSGLGRTMITSGLLLLLFAAYQLWGTGIYAAQQQDHLETAFERAQRAAAATSTTTTTTSAPPDTAPEPAEPPLVDVPPPPNPPAAGEPLAQIRIPKLDVDWTVVEGTSVADLRKGPGHFAGAPMPGQYGNAAIAGHRTTYGAPFNRVDELVPGDEIRIETLWGGNYLYRVTALTAPNGFAQDVFGVTQANRDTESKGVFPVSPRDIDVLWWYKSLAEAATPGPEYLPTLTLTTCHPEYSARQRLIVTAVLVPEESDAPVAAPDGTQQETFSNRVEQSASLDESNSGPEFDRERDLAIRWGLGVIAIGLLWWFVFHRHKKWYVWFAGAVPFLGVLFLCYVHIERMLPSSI
jgi:sortase A